MKLGKTAKLSIFITLAGCASHPHSARVPSSTETPAPAIEPAPPQPKPEGSYRGDREAKNEEPAGPQSLTISLPQISTELGIPRARLESQTKILARYIETNALPHGICSDDDDQSTERLCSMIELIENNPSQSRARYSSGRRVPIRPHHFASQQGMSFGRLMRSLGREPVTRVMAWAPQMLATTSCPRNLSAVALRKLESGLPNPAVRNMMEKLYEHATACLSPQDEGYEITHLRQGLLRLQWGNKAGAKIALEKAAVAEDSMDRPRVLYWAGRLQSNPQARKRYWDRLVEEFPLSFHALEVWRERNQDPLQIFETRPAVSLSRHSDNEHIDTAMRWLEALYILEKPATAQKLARWMNNTYKDELPPSTALYISALKSSRGTPLNTITFLTQQMNDNPTMLNRQTLRLLFPRPFFEVFARNSPSTDTSLVLAVARQESGFNPRARSPANAQGLLQLLPSTARRLSGHRRNNLYDSETNANLGVKYLSQLIEKFGSVELALAAYNAGPGHIDEWKDRFGSNDQTLFLDLIPFKETRHYVANIVRNNYWYERLYNNSNRSIASTHQQKSDIVANLVQAHIEARNRQAMATTQGEGKKEF